MISQARSFASHPRWRAFALLALVLPSLAACMSLETIIRVNPDGSGTVERTFLATNEMLVGLLTELDDGELCSDEASLEVAAASMGAGVRVSSVETIDGESGPGCRAVLEFDDINELDFDLDATFLVPVGVATAMGEDPADADREELLHFRFEPGDPAGLHIEIAQAWDEGAAEAEGEMEEPEDEDEDVEDADEEDADSAADEADDLQRQAGLAAMRSMLAGSRFALIIELAGSVVESDASYVEDNRVTILEMDFDALLDSGQDLEEIFDSEPGSAAEMRAVMAEVEGMKIETENEVTIRFRGSSRF